MATRGRYHLKQHTTDRDGEYHTVLNEMGEEVFAAASLDDAEEIASLRTQLHQALDALHAIANNQEVAYLKQNSDEPYSDKPRIDLIEDIADTVHAVICTLI